MAAAGPAKTQAADISVCLNFLTRSQTLILVCGMLTFGDGGAESRTDGLSLQACSERLGWCCHTAGTPGADVLHVSPSAAIFFRVR